MDFFNNHKLFNKLEYNVRDKKEYFTLTSSKLDYSTKKEQDLGTLFLKLLNLSEEELNNLGNNLGELKHVVNGSSNNYEAETLLIKKIKGYIDNTLSNYNCKDSYLFFSITCGLGYFKGISSTEYYDVSSLPREIISNKYDSKKITNAFDYIKSKKIKAISKYEINSFEDFIVASLSEILKSKLYIIRCDNCGKYFTSKKNSAQYCSNPSPQNPLKPCKKFKPEQDYNQSLATDINKSNRRRISKNLNKNKNRKGSSIYAKKQYEKKAEEFKNMKKKLRLGEITEETISNWIEENGLRKDSRN